MAAGIGAGFINAGFELVVLGRQQNKTLAVAGGCARACGELAFLQQHAPRLAGSAG
jgi:hypothetical protein